jgi:hypothetical protein
MLSQTTDEKYQGIIQGFSGSLSKLTSIAGLLAGGVLYTRLSGWIFLLSAINIFIIFLITLCLN